MSHSRPVMLVGNAGCGKTVLINDKLNSMDENIMVTTIPFNYYTTSLMLQQIMEKPLEKKAGRNYGPPGSKKLVYFIDDMNMPVVDTYGTVQPHTLIRQHLDYSHWYDRAKLTLKEVHNVQYVACMNPTAGSFTINSRLQRHFSVFAISFPGNDALHTIYQNILNGHLSVHGFSSPVVRFSDKIVSAALALHNKIATSFLPTAVKFHYIFNLRDLSNIFQVSEINVHVHVHCTTFHLHTCTYNVRACILDSLSFLSGPIIFPSRLYKNSDRLCPIVAT